MLLPDKRAVAHVRGGRKGEGIMKYMTVSEAARRWGVSERLVQRYCAQGRIDGAERFSRTWRIPEGTVKPGDPRSASTDPQPVPKRRTPSTCSNLMPLMNAPFKPGHARSYADSLEAGERRDVALTELAYFTGDARRAAELARKNLSSPDLEIRLSCCLIFSYASLALGEIDEARTVLEHAMKSLAASKEKGQDGSLSATAAFITRTACVLLHLPDPEGLPSARETLPLLPSGLRMFSCYVEAHRLYLDGQYETSLGLALGAFAMMDEVYPIPAIYLHLIAVMDLMALRRVEDAKRHLLAAWNLARPDDLIEPLGEHHGLLGGMLEAVIKPSWPDDFRRIIEITYRFSAGWRRIHNPDTGDKVADNLTTTEFAAAMLAARGWTNQEIAEHLGVSPNTVKSFISIVLRKLGVKRRQDLTAHLLR